MTHKVAMVARLRSPHWLLPRVVVAAADGQQTLGETAAQEAERAQVQLRQEEPAHLARAMRVLLV
jgi:hypothetical protein